ncbi:GntR family transcriptional regulator [Acuticoccus sp. M5D2P5]|uniref:GntR family transcriptional regulator n=1 Tax=Acuticoccus kalidii TaxID=2910977 RepID=UPI001F3EE238|nr:GntR family transcriptional regulator [Acuticoccus kalidii]MCF3935382.1 GntR family transcriptional regulator [Acuticoccus kalidii]
MSNETGSRADEIVKMLEEELLAGSLAPGERLDERGLAARFGTSRTPVREALQRLSASGIVTVQSRQGASVAQLDVADLFDSFTVNAELEALAASQAARRILPDQRDTMAEMHKVCAAAARAGDHIAFNEANGRFHAVIIAASHNRILAAQIRTAQLFTAPYRRRITFQPGRMLVSVEEHQRIVDAILANDAESAAGEMRLHVNQLGNGAGDVLHHLRISSRVELAG